MCVLQASVVHLVNYQHSTYLHQAREGWLDKMASLVEKLYCQETRNVLGWWFFGVLKEVVGIAIALPFLSSVAVEEDRVVRLQTVQTVALFASKATGSHLLDLVEVQTKIEIFRIFMGMELGKCCATF